jgi:chromosomal replication initiator protein
MSFGEVRFIPFPGKPLEYENSTVSQAVFPVSQHGFMIGPENYVLEPVVQWAVEGNLPRDRLPLLFYGAVGSGRSHLLRGILDAWRKNQKALSPHKRHAFLLPAVDFARLFTESLDTRTTDDFRRRYRGAALLLIDDLDQLHDKPWAQEELRHTLDSLSRNGGTAVLVTTDYPGEKGIFSEAFAARLIGGTTLPVFLPGLAVRKHFLRELAVAFRVSLPDSVLDSAAESLPVSIPALYGTFAQIYFEAAAADTKINTASWKLFLQNRLQTVRPGVDVIAKRTAKHFSLKLADLRGSSRAKTVALARSIAVYLAWQQTGQQQKEIARYFGNRDPATIRHMIERIKTGLSEDTTLRDHLFRLGLH